MLLKEEEIPFKGIRINSKYAIAVMFWTIVSGAILLIFILNCNVVVFQNELVQLNQA